MTDNFIQNIQLGQNNGIDYPYNIPAVKQIEKIVFNSPVTFIIGENGTGKSTIIEAIAIVAGFPGEGGTKNMKFSTYNSTSDLHNSIKLIRGPRREKDGYFLRAESFYNVASYMEEPNPEGPLRYGGKVMHNQSHGESFMWLINHRFYGNGLYLFDEPEAALSPQRQLSLLVAINNLTKTGSQFIISTHSPIVLSYPEAIIYQLSNSGIEKVKYEDAENVKLSRDYLNNPDLFLKELIK
jgi:predicted ATPase